MNETLHSDLAKRLMNEFAFNKIVLQPTTTCNLNCSYCYLGDRRIRNRMSIDTAKAIARSIEELGRHILLIWHGGEPLATGRQYFRDLLEPFEALRHKGLVSHCLQTNATLVNDAWCEIFRTFDIKVGVSIDGPEELNIQRVDWTNQPTFDRIIVGIGCLVRNGIQFSAICVLSSRHLTMASELYDFFCGLGCSSLGFNTPEREGTNDLPAADFPELNQFWADLYSAWERSPSIRVRELSYVISWVDSCIRRNTISYTPKMLDLIPTISCNGDVVFLSPEFAGVQSEQHRNFIVGNINQSMLSSITETLPKTLYYQDFVKGVQKCRDSCEYFSFCGGGQASNKFFEHGRIDITETAYCRNTKQRLVDAVLTVM